MHRRAAALIELHVVHARAAGKLVRLAAHELAGGLSAMLGEGVRVAPVDGRDPHALAVGAFAPHRGASASAGGSADAAARAPDAGVAEAAGDDGFAVRRGDAPGAVGAGRIPALVIAAAGARAALHGVYDLLERLGARLALGRAPVFPRIERARLAALAPYRVMPAFSRRAFVSDIMTWHYHDAARLRMHLAHDHEFAAWMGWRGANAFAYIRHAQDARLKINEMMPMLAARGIAPEYGGHVLPLLLPRERFDAHPEYFPCGADGSRVANGNLCVSSAGALKLVQSAAIGYVRENPEMAMLHVWGADLRGGGWCRCAQCAALSPQLQYMAVINAIADALGTEGPSPGLPVSYLAYHDTLEADPALRPRENVWFEWAPRERCYGHAIDDPACAVNPRYLESLKRHMDLFDGRGSVFEYYADAILFGGMGFASPSVIVSDLRAYHRIGLRSISCLTFGAFSALAYPVNLETFARVARALDYAPEAGMDEIAAARHFGCGPAMARAYREVARASALALRYGDVMRPPAEAAGASRRRARLIGAAAAMREGVKATDTIVKSTPGVGAERDLWKYSAEALQGLARWLEAQALTGAERRAAGLSAIEEIDRAFRHVRRIDTALRGTWGAFDLERHREAWLERLRRGLGE
ncbi:MAG TPA: DUF4838 domain-containing protein [Candidatus Binataceae bacterium]|nr:DUF4838 domain-containing protein [Candidatus Binataceae bacterium]